MFRFVLKSLRYYWRSHLAILAGVFLASTVLTGALFVGNSVKAGLKGLIAERYGPIDSVLLGNDRFFTAALGEKVKATTGHTAVPILQVRGTVTNRSSSVRENGVNVIGVPDSFWQLSAKEKLDGITSNKVRLNAALAQRLQVSVGDEVIARMEQPGALSRDAPLSGETDNTVSLTLEVQDIASGDAFGNFSLKAEQTAPMNLFVPYDNLAKALDKAGRANLLLISGDDVDEDALQAAIDESWNADDTDLVLEVREGVWEIVSRRVLLDLAAESSIRELQPDAQGVFTYLINEIGAGDGGAPYSMVTAAAPGSGPLPADLEKGETMINQWLAEDLGLTKGDDLTLAYSVFGPGRELIEKTSSFKVREILPMDHPDMNAGWTPDFPGVSDSENCRDWEPGIDVDLNKIRDKDEDYWDDYKGTPKAFISLAAGQELWSNRFGQLTSMRFPPAFEAEPFREALDAKLTPDRFGVSLINLASSGERAVTNSLDFGMYLSAFSYFIIIAAIILTVLLFALSIDQRESQLGTMRALGFKAGRVRKILFIEGGIIALLGSLLGIIGGLLYTKGMIAALSTVWRGAIGDLQIRFSPDSLAGLAGAYGIFFMALIAIFFATRRVSKRRPVELIHGTAEQDFHAASTPLVKQKKFWLALLLLGGAILSLSGAGSQSDPMKQAGGFFAGGMLILVSGLLLASLLLQNLGRLLGRKHQLAALGIRNSSRRRGRSLAVIIIMAAGVFMICATNAFRLDATKDASIRASGTGGFQLVGESSLSIYEDLNDGEKREFYGLDDEELDFSLVPFRVREGEEASCLNLNRAQRPRLMAVDPQLLAERQAFSFKGAQGWGALNEDLGEGVVPGIMDMNSATYAMGLTLGDEITYEDELGRPWRVRLVGLLQGSLLQGNVIVSEPNYTKAFPSAGGYRYFLVDTPAEKAGELSATMTRMLEDLGFSLTSTADRLNAFNNVQNTYLQMFSVLGGLGLLLGTAGLAVVTFRNILDRRRELALMEAVGFKAKRLSWLVLSEHWFLHIAAVILGVVAALLAVFPAMRASGQGMPLGLITGLVGLILLGGVVFCWWAARSVLKRPFLESLRHE